MVHVNEMTPLLARERVGTGGCKKTSYNIQIERNLVTPLSLSLSLTGRSERGHSKPPLDLRVTLFLQFWSGAPPAAKERKGTNQRLNSVGARACASARGRRRAEAESKREGVSEAAKETRPVSVMFSPKCICPEPTLDGRNSACIGPLGHILGLLSIYVRERRRGRAGNSGLHLLEYDGN